MFEFMAMVLKGSSIPTRCNGFEKKFHSYPLPYHSPPDVTRVRSFSSRFIRSHDNNDFAGNFKFKPSRAADAKKPC